MSKLKVTDHQNTKVVATIGPASSSEQNLRNLIRAGADVFRLNFSHGSHEDHKKVIDNITTLNETYGLHIGILADLQGPKIRVGEVENNGVKLVANKKITFTTKKCIGTKDLVPIQYAKFPQDVEVNERILLDDGKLVLKVLKTNKKDLVELKVLHGGILSSRKGVNLPDSVISLPSLTPKDLKDLKFILTQKEVNWIALSFVRTAQDVVNLQRKIKRAGHIAKVIAKVEKPQAVENIKEIVKVSDAIMIARGDLGVEVPMEKLPAIQKDIIKRCIQSAKPSIVATQMMESMITNPSPTRAEITDVANAVLDGADAVMLSGETSVGNHPALVVKAMNKIISEAEKNYEMQGKRPKPNKKNESYFSDTICISAARIADDVNSKAILGITVSGYTAFKVSSYRPKSKIYIFSSVKPMLATMNLIWGVKTFYYNKFSTTDQTIEDLISILKDRGLLKKGETVVNTASMPLKKRFKTNMLKITIVE